MSTCLPAMQCRSDHNTDRSSRTISVYQSDDHVSVLARFLRISMPGMTYLASKCMVLPPWEQGWLLSQQSINAVVCKRQRIPLQLIEFTLCTGLTMQASETADWCLCVNVSPQEKQPKTAAYL